MANHKLLSGRVKVTPAANVAADRYNYLGLEQAEPNLGVANADGWVLTYSTSSPGNRLWQSSSLLSGGLVAQSAFSTANNAEALSTSAYIHANAAFDKANTVGLHANGAFAAANSKFSSSGGTISGDTNITGNLTVVGITTYANTQTVLIADNILTLNAAIGQSAQPSVNAGIEIDRGAQPNAQFIWVESSGKWSANNGNGSIFIAAESAESYANGAFAAANNSVQSTGLTNTRIPYANATGFLQDSNNLIWDNANQVLKPGAGGTEIGGDAGYGYVSASKLYATGITSGRVVYVGASGLLVGNSNFAFTGTQLNVTGNVAANNIVANGINLFDYTSSAYIHANAAFAAANTISGGAVIDNVARLHANSSYTHANASFDKANTGSKSTASTTAPVSPSVGDMWYDTETDVLLRYTNDGTSNNWIDITGPIIRSTYIRPTYLITANAS